ncbi:VOC family protein [Neobacillus sp. D3-1R]|uniref:VOC family protein n=1 Tax=Neobacillus sp. D3-1R TaxID=3445778 RepID=UPI003F9F2EE4
MIFEITYQVRVTDFSEGEKWYSTLLNRRPDFIPHEGFAEWELIPGTWLQLAEGTPSDGCGPIRFGVPDIKAEQGRVRKELYIEDFEIFSKAEVPVKWGTFSDPWGNRLGFFEYINKQEQADRMNTILGKVEDERRKV